MGTILPFMKAVATDASVPEPMRTDAAESVDGTPDGERWAQWMLQAQDGDRAAYHALLKALTPYLRAITRRYLGRTEDAEDAVQDILMVVHGIRHTYERGRPFKPWLSTIASRRCIDILRRRAHRLQHEMATGEDIEDVAHAGHSPEDTLSRQQDAGTLRHAVAGLPERAHLAVENGRIAVVVGDGGQDRAVGGQRNRRQPLTFHLETADQFGGEVLRVGGRTAVAAGQNFAVAEQGADHQFGSLGNRGGEQFDGVEFGLGAVLEMLAYA